MTTQTLVQAINLRHELTLEDLLRFAPQLAGYVKPQPAVAWQAAAPAREQAQAEQAFWSTFSFGCLQAVVLFSLIYAYFVR